MTNNNTEAAPKSDAFRQGRSSSTLFATAVCPYAETSKEAGEWADGLLEGRNAFAWNVRGLVGLGSTSKYINDAIATPLAIGLAKGIFHLGAEAPVLWRLGWILASHDAQVPVLDVPAWYRLAKVVNFALAGREIDDHELDPPNWMERIAFLEAKDFQIRIIGFPVAVDARERAFEADVAKLLQWMGGESPGYADQIEKTSGA